MPALEQMRELAAEHRLPIVIGSAAAALLLVLVVSYCSFRGGTSMAPPPKDPFFDEKTNRIVMVAPGQVPPIEFNGATLVRARLAPGSRDQILYLETYSKEGKDGLESVLKGAPPAARVGILSNGFAGRMVRSPKAGSPWLPADSPEAQTLLSGATP